MKSFIKNINEGRYSFFFPLKNCLMRVPIVSKLSSKELVRTPKELKTKTFKTKIAKESNLESKREAPLEMENRPSKSRYKVLFGLSKKASTPFVQELVVLETGNICFPSRKFNNEDFPDRAGPIIDITFILEKF